MEGWMTCDFTSFSVVFSVISGQWDDDIVRLCGMEPGLRLHKRFLLEAWIKPGTARSAGQRLTSLPSEWPKLYGVLAILGAMLNY